MCRSESTQKVMCVSAIVLIVSLGVNKAAIVLVKHIENHRESRHCYQANCDEFDGVSTAGCVAKITIATLNVFKSRRSITHLFLLFP